MYGQNLYRQDKHIRYTMVERLRCSPPKPPQDCIEAKYSEDITYNITVVITLLFRDYQL